MSAFKIAIAILLGLACLGTSMDLGRPPSSGSGATSTTAHGDLTGLTGSDDHTQYLELDGSDAMSGNLDLNGLDLVLDADADSIVHCTADDACVLVAGGVAVASWAPDALTLGEDGNTGNFTITLNGDGATSTIVHNHTTGALAFSSEILADGNYIDTTSGDLWFQRENSSTFRIATGGIVMSSGKNLTMAGTGALTVTGNATLGSGNDTLLLQPTSTVTIGNGGAGVDYCIDFDGETSDSDSACYMEDEDRLQFNDPIYGADSATVVGTLTVAHSGGDTMAITHNDSFGSFTTSAGDIRLFPASGWIAIGTGAAGVDYGITVDGESNDGALWYFEDEDLWSIDAIECMGTLEARGDMTLDTAGSTADYTITFRGDGATSTLVHAHDTGVLTYSDDISAQTLTVTSASLTDGNLTNVGAISADSITGEATALALASQSNGNVTVDPNGTGDIHLLSDADTLVGVGDGTYSAGHSAGFLVETVAEMDDVLWCDAGITSTTLHLSSDMSIDGDVLSDIHLVNSDKIRFSADGQDYIFSNGVDNISMWIAGVRASYWNTTGMYVDEKLSTTAHTTIGNGPEDQITYNADLSIFNDVMRFRQNTGAVASGDIFRWDSYAAASMTDTDAQQSFFTIEPEVEQTGTASYAALKIDVEETSTGSGQDYLVDAQVGSSTIFAVEPDGDVSTTGDITSSDTGDIGWSLGTGADTACNTTCTSACVFGFDDDNDTIVNCADAAADKCICAGSS